MATAFDKRGGGQAMPPFLQGRTAKGPMITPKASVVPGEVAKPNVQPMNAAAAAPAPAAPAGNQPTSLYDYYKKDLKSNVDADASARGVFYGTPASSAYSSGLATLQANMLEKQQQEEMARLGLATNLLNSSPAPSGGGGMDPQTMQMLGAMFGGSATAQSARKGPAITPKKTGVDENLIPKDMA